MGVPARLGAVVLAGGRSTRMGRDKASLPFGAGTLLSRVAGVVAEVADEVVVVARPRQVPPDLGPLRAGVRVLGAVDEVEGRGPLAGLVAGLSAASAAVVYATSCDVPFLTPAFVARVVGALGPAAVAIPRAGGRLHPLAAAYRRDAVLPVARALLAADRLRPVFLLEALPHVVVEEKALREADPGLDALANLNTPAEYEAALARLAAGGL